MREALGEILNSYKGIVSEDMVLKYVSGNASVEEVRHIEQMMTADPFLADAIEGLKMGDLETHKKQIFGIKNALQNDKSKIFKISISSIAVAASLVLVTYFGFKILPGFKKEASPETAVSAISADTVSVSLQEPKMDSAASQISLNYKPIPEEEAKISADKSVGNANYNEVTANGAASGKKQDFVSMKQEAADDLMEAEEANSEMPAPIQEQSVSRENDLTLNKNVEGVYYDKNVKLDTVSISATQASSYTTNTELNKASTSTYKWTNPKVMVLSVGFQQVAMNTKNMVADMAMDNVDFKSSKKSKAKTNCVNCPDKKEIAQKNADVDTIAISKAEQLYNTGKYAEAAKWYYRQNDNNSKIMAGVAFLQANDAQACKNIEKELLKSSSYASDYLRSLRLVSEGKGNDAYNLWQRLIDKKTVYASVAEQNQNTITKK